MRAYLALCRKELAGYFYSPIAYVVEMFFSVADGFWYADDGVYSGQRYADLRRDAGAVWREFSFFGWRC